MSLIVMNTQQNKGNSTLPSVVKVCYFAMNDKMVQRLATMFKIIFKDRFRFVSSDEAMVALININSGNVNTTDLLSLYQKKYTSLPIVALVDSLPDMTIQDNVYFIEKPLKRDNFLKAVTELLIDDNNLKSVSSEQLNKASQAKTASSAKILNSRISKQSSEPVITRLKGEDQADTIIYFNAKKHLVSCFHKIMNDKYEPHSCIKVNVVNKYSVVLYPDKKLVSTNLTRSQFRSISYMKFESFDNNKMCALTIDDNINLTEQVLEDTVEGHLIMTYDAFLWRLALQTSRGRLPKNTSINQKFSLHVWPNLTRLDKTPEAMRIASLWNNTPYTLHEIITILDIDAKDVYAFYTAASFIGLIDIDSEEKSKSEELQKAVINNKKRGLFGAILRRLTGTT